MENSSPLTVRIGMVANGDSNADLARKTNQNRAQVTRLFSGEAALPRSVVDDPAFHQNYPLIDALIEREMGRVSVIDTGIAATNYRAAESPANTPEEKALYLNRAIRADIADGFPYDGRTSPPTLTANAAVVARVQRALGEMATLKVREHLREPLRFAVEQNRCALLMLCEKADALAEGRPMSKSSAALDAYIRLHDRLLKHRTIGLRPSGISADQARLIRTLALMTMAAIVELLVETGSPQDVLSCLERTAAAITTGKKRQRSDMLQRHLDAIVHDAAWSHNQAALRSLLPSYVKKGAA